MCFGQPSFLLFLYEKFARGHFGREERERESFVCVLNELLRPRISLCLVFSDIEWVLHCRIKIHLQKRECCRTFSVCM